MTQFIATVATGIEDLLVNELRMLGISEAKPIKSGARFEGTLKDAYRVVLWSRVANRVLMPILNAPVLDETALYEAALGVSWADHLLPEATFAVDATIIRSNITHSKFAALKVKDAIVDQMRDEAGNRPSIEVKTPDLQVNVFIDRNQLQLAIDLSGASLHARGYRHLGGIATLKENLAAAILYRAGWPEIAKQGGAFVDFMCGSGTLPIEAALMACDIAPALDRQYFGFKRWAGHDAEGWEALLAEARERRQAGLQHPPVIQGFDHHRPTLAKAEAHVERAGLARVVQIAYQDVTAFNVDVPATGLVVINAPYGNRVGEADELESLYESIGQVLKTTFKGWRASVLTDEQEKGKWLGIRADKIHSLFNGNIPVKLISMSVADNTVIHQYRLPRLINHDELSEAGLGFANRLKKNRKKLSGWLKQSGVSCYRVYDADLPDYSAAIDVYEADSTCLHIQEYEAPSTIDPKRAKQRLSELVSVAKDVFDLDAEQVFLKQRKKQKGASQYEKLGDEKNFSVVREGEGQFLVNFEDYLDTGLFLDHRPIRKRIFEESDGKTLLNLFAYTGAVTVQAALGGASASLTIDMSKTYLNWAKRNFKLNNLDVWHHELLQADCVEWLKRPTVKERFDIIFLDPPSFSNSKRMENTLDIQKDYASLVTGAMNLLAPGGVLYFSTNLRGFKLAAELNDQFAVTDITSATIPPDFTQRKHIHRCFEIRAGEMASNDESSQFVESPYR